MSAFGPAAVVRAASRDRVEAVRSWRLRIAAKAPWGFRLAGRLLFGVMTGEGLGQLSLLAWSIGVIPAARPSDYRSAHDRAPHYRPPRRSTCNASDTHGGQRSPHTRLRAINGQ